MIALVNEILMQWSARSLPTFLLLLLLLLALVRRQIKVHAPLVTEGFARGPLRSGIFFVSGSLCPAVAAYLRHERAITLERFHAASLRQRDARARADAHKR